MPQWPCADCDRVTLASADLNIDAKRVFSKALESGLQQVSSEHDHGVDGLGCLAGTGDVHAPVQPALSSA